MENYKQGESVDVHEDENQFSHLEVDLTSCIKMVVKDGGKIRNYMSFALKEFKKEKRNLIMFSGSGEAVNKVISCIEIMKRSIKGLHQITKIFYKMKEDYWEPKADGLDRLKVKRHIPAISVLLSKVQLDSNEPGYQDPGNMEEQWNKEVAQEKKDRQRHLESKRSQHHLFRQTDGSKRKNYEQSGRPVNSGFGPRSIKHKKKKNTGRKKEEEKPEKMAQQPTKQEKV